MDPLWFAIWTRSRHEKIVRDQLEKKTDVDVFLPTIGKWSRWKDRKKKIDWPLFPGYVFARFVPDERIGILKVDGVVQSISNNGVLSPIPDEEIDHGTAQLGVAGHTRAIDYDRRGYDAEQLAIVVDE